MDDNFRALCLKNLSKEILSIRQEATGIHFYNVAVKENGVQGKIEKVAVLLPIIRARCRNRRSRNLSKVYLVSDRKVFEEFLNFLYSGECDWDFFLNSPIVLSQELYYLSLKFGVPDLIEACTVLLPTPPETLEKPQKIQYDRDFLINIGKSVITQARLNVLLGMEKLVIISNSEENVKNVPDANKTISELSTSSIKSEEASSVSNQGKSKFLESLPMPLPTAIITPTNKG